MSSKNKQSIKFEADITGFKSNIKEAEKSITSLNNTLKLNKAQLAGNSESTQLLSQRVEQLKEKYKEQGIAIDNTKLAYEKAVEELGANSEEAEKLKKKLIELQTAQQRTANEIDKTNKELIIQSEKFTLAGEKITKFGDKVEKIGSRLSILSAGATAIGIASLKSSISFESAWTGVTKTVEGTEAQLKKLKQGIVEMSTQLPSTVEEISAVAESAGQLGIETDNVLSFTKTMIDMGNSTNLSAEEAATTLARFANVTRMSQSDFDKLGSVIVALGNKFATTESEIADMGMNLASAGTQVGMSQSQIMALATALSSVGLEAQAGGTAFSKVMVNMQLAVEKGGNSLKDFASVAGMSSQDFQKAFKEDATNAIMKFVEGLSKSGEQGKSAIKILDDMGITETRLRDALLRSANASKVMEKAIVLGNEAWEENNALVEEANKRYETTESQIDITKNKIKAQAISLGDKLLPEVNKILDKTEKWIDKLDDLSDSQKESIVKTGLMVVAAGPLVKILGSVTSTIGTTVKGIGTFSQAIKVMNTGTESTNASVNSLAKAISAIKSPIGLATGAVTIATTAIVFAIKNAEKDTKEAFSNMGNSANDFINGIDTATSYLDNFNSELFASSEEQQKLEEEMDKVQQGITKICKTASDERRGYTQEEITQLDEYFTKLRELNQREIEIQQQISGAITQQAVTNAETFKGTLEEYKTQSQQWLKTAEEQKEKTVALIESQTIEEVALLNTRYTTEEEKQSEAYQKEYNKIMEQKQVKIDATNDEIAKINEAYTNGYLERAKQEDGWFTKLQEYNQKVEDENTRHNATIDSNNNNALLTQYNKNQANEQENYRHQNETKKIWDKMYKDMSEEQEKELGEWLARMANTELYGGKISEENQKMVDSIMDSYNSMPKGTRDAMKNAMQPMLEEMEKKEPSLFAKATGIAEGILSRLKKSFDIHSPSKKTRKIFDYVMQGAKLGLEDEEENIYKQVDTLANNVLDKFNGININNKNMPTLQNYRNNKEILDTRIVDKTKTIFTTPNLTIYTQEFDARKIANEVNKVFGSAY